jgi:hypothetical protein
LKRENVLQAIHEEYNGEKTGRGRYGWNMKEHCRGNHRGKIFFSKTDYEDSKSI